MPLFLRLPPPAPSRAYPCTRRFPLSVAQVVKKGKLTLKTDFCCLSERCLPFFVFFLAGCFFSCGRVRALLSTLCFWTSLFFPARLNAAGCLSALELALPFAHGPFLRVFSSDSHLLLSSLISILYVCGCPCPRAARRLRLQSTEKFYCVGVFTK